MRKLTQSRLKELLHYDRRTGLFTRRVTRGNAGKGTLVGTKSPKGYLTVEVDGHNYQLHTLAWLYVKGVWAPQLDHKDTDKQNNRIGNLRPCTTQQNCAGRSLRKDNATGFKGVSRVGDRFRARIRVGYLAVDLGRYPTARAAAQAYDKAAVLHFGAFARTNKTMGLL